MSRDQLDDLAIPRVAAQLELREDGFTVHRDLERATGRFHQPHVGVGESRLELGRRPGGP
jgi:hypothetical protein